MRRELKSRLDQLEARSKDYTTQLPFIDYVGLTDYDNGEWLELHFDSTITVLENLETGEVRGVYQDRRSKAEIVAAGGNLAYL